MKFKRPCLTCGQLGQPGESYCPTHTLSIQQQTEARRTAVKKATGQYSGSYQRRAKQVRATATICHLCGKGYNPNDPWQADHVTPADPNSQLLPAHASCNQARGNKTI